MNLSTHLLIDGELVKGEGLLLRSRTLPRKAQALAAICQFMHWMRTPVFATLCLHTNYECTK